MIETGDEPGKQQREVAGRHGRHKIADGKDAHQQDQRSAFAETAEGERHEGSADHDADRIGADQEAGGRDRDINSFGNHREKPHR